MSFYDLAIILKDYNGVILVGVIAILSIIEVTPLKFNPWECLGKWIFSSIKKDIDKTEEGIKSIKNELDCLKRDQEANEIKRIRWEILNFANALQHGQEHTQDAYEHIIEIHDDYEQLITKNNIKNGRVNKAFAFIQHKYDEHLHNNDFLV